MGGDAVTLDQVLEFVKSTRGFDFTGYKRSSVERRVRKRMSDVGISTYEDYVDYLELNGEEFAELFNTLLINVTRFFRDPETWEHLAESVIPELARVKEPDAPIRVWCPGCASGQEAYTVAMVLARVLGEDAFRERVKIYATDIDEAALEQARHGAYPPRALETVPREALQRFFELTDQRYVFRRDLRRSVIFGRNDLIRDAPISRVDLLICRNTFMYFTAETQGQILRRFHFALDDEGVLLLGKSEMLITHTDLFTPIDLKWRLFRKVIRRPSAERSRPIATASGDDAALGTADNLREAAFDLTPLAQLVLDADGALVMANRAARRLFSLGVNEIGRPIQDLELSYRPVELRAHLDVVARERRVVELQGVRWPSGDEARVLDVRLAPLSNDGFAAGTSIVYQDVTETTVLKRDVDDSRKELEQAYEELQSTVEELETTNEELQSTNEELETTNEELQSTNEELETTNEELQSSNKELETINDELRHRTSAIAEMNSMLETILTTIGLAVAVLDPRMDIQVWNGQARELWGVTPEEATGQHLLGLDIGLPVDELKGPIRNILAGTSERENLSLPATNRRGRPFTCEVSCLPLWSGSSSAVQAVIVMMIPAAA